MPGRRRRSYIYRGNKDKYSVESKSFNVNPATGIQTEVVIVPSTSLEGMRKVKHIEVSMSSNSQTDVLFWSLVYVPSGTDASVMSQTGSLYEPSQFVLCCGVLDFTAGPNRIRSPVSRNLNQGDSIRLLLLRGGAADMSLIGVVRYAITLQ